MADRARILQLVPPLAESAPLPAAAPALEPFEVHTFSPADGFTIQGAYDTDDEARETAELLVEVEGGTVAIARVYDIRRAGASKWEALHEFKRGAKR